MTTGTIRAHVCVCQGCHLLRQCTHTQHTQHTQHAKRAHARTGSIHGAATRPLSRASCLRVSEAVCAPTRSVPRRKLDLCPSAPVRVCSFPLPTSHILSVSVSNAIDRRFCSLTTALGLSDVPAIDGNHARRRREIPLNQGGEEDLQGECLALGNRLGKQHVSQRRRRACAEERELVL